jgi:hypothetical protein
MTFAEGYSYATQTTLFCPFAPLCASNGLQSAPGVDSKCLIRSFGVEGTTCHKPPRDALPPRCVTLHSNVM